MVNSKNYLNVPYAEKNAAKALGAKWDAAKKKWYVPLGMNVNCFSKWNTKIVEKKQNQNDLYDNSLSGITTYPKDKDFIAYNGEIPPWD